MLGVAAGIGFTIVFFDLLPAAVQIGSFSSAAAGFIGGILLGRMVDVLLPHIHVSGLCPTCAREHFDGNSIPASQGLLKTASLLGLGVALHNLPEGLAIGAGLKADEKLGIMLSLAIGIHNIPEGMALAGLLRAAGQGHWKAVLVTAAAGLFIPAGAIIGQFYAVAPLSISAMLALGAGALLYVVWSELIPESCRMHGLFSRLGIAGGLLLSLFISISC
jgi:ZIP family zinc transporter